MRKFSWCRWIVFFSLVLGLVVFAIDSAEAWTTTGQRWPGSPRFTVKIRSGTPSAVYTAYEDAVQDWYEADSRIVITHSSSSPNEMYAIWDSDSAYMGGMYPSPANGSTITKFDIWINTFHSGGPNFYRSVAGHELGHVMGLGHESGNVIMNWERDRDRIYTPRQDDIEGVLILYGYMEDDSR